MLWIAVCAHAQPDLVTNPASANPHVVSENFFASDCAVVEGCTSAGLHRLVVFNTETRNEGTTDLVLGNPVGNPLFDYFPCHNHYHMKSYMDYRLRDPANNQIVAGYKQSFCLADTFRFDANAPASPHYTCNNQGLQVGWADIYNSSLPCQWVDVTTVTAGNYILEMEVNPDHLLVESNYLNNITTVPVTIPVIMVPANDACASATLLLDGMVTDSTAFATNDGSSNCGNSASANDVWYRYVPLATGPAHFSMCTSTFDTVLSIHSGCPGTSANTLQCNDDSNGPDCLGGSQSELTTTLTQGMEYMVRVSGFNGANGVFSLAVTGPQAPSTVMNWKKY